MLFLYHRVYQTALRQLDSLKSLDFGSLERLTAEREGVTRELCGQLREMDADPETGELDPASRKRIHDLTTRTLDIDLEIKTRLLSELRRRCIAVACGSGVAERPD